LSNHRKSITPRVTIQLLLVIVVIPFRPLLISWNWIWWEAWVYAILCILGLVVSRVLAARIHPVGQAGCAGGDLGRLRSF